MDGRYESPSSETEDDARRKVVFPKAMTKLEILVKHVAERQRYRLFACQNVKQSAFSARAHFKKNVRGPREVRIPPR